MRHQTFIRFLGIAAVGAGFIASAALAAKPGGGSPSCPRSYTMTMLPNGLAPIEINAAGMVLARTNGDLGIAIVFVNDTGTVTGTATASVPGSAWRINELGWVVGQYRPVGASHDRTWLLIPEDTNSDGVADLWMRDLDGDGLNDLVQALPVPVGLGDRDTWVGDVNESWTVVGMADFAEGDRCVAWTRDEFGMWWADAFGATPSSAADVNNRGWAVGSPAMVWMLDSDGALLGEQGLGSLGGGCCMGVAAVNSSGDVAGLSTVAGSGLRHAALVVPEDTNNDGTPDNWYRDNDANGANDLMRDLGKVGSAVEVWAVDVNDSRQVVGVLDYSVGGGNRSTFLWEGGTMYDVGKCITNRDRWELRDVYAISNRGQILGLARRSGAGITIGYYVLTPR